MRARIDVDLLIVGLLDLGEHELLVDLAALRRLVLGLLNDLVGSLRSDEGGELRLCLDQGLSRFELVRGLL